MLVRDPIKIIALQLVDPVLQFKRSDHTAFNAFIKKNDNNYLVISDTMSTKMG